MSKNLLLFISILGSSFLAGCGGPSVNDVCGRCSGMTRSQCELAYDACKDDRSCDLDDLKEAFNALCASGSFLTVEDGGL